MIFIVSRSNRGCLEPSKVLLKFESALYCNNVWSCDRKCLLDYSSLNKWRITKWNKYPNLVSWGTDCRECKNCELTDLGEIKLKTNCNLTVTHRNYSPLFNFINLNIILKQSIAEATPWTHTETYKPYQLNHSILALIGAFSDHIAFPMYPSYLTNLFSISIPSSHILEAFRTFNRPLSYLPPRAGFLGLLSKQVDTEQIDRPLEHDFWISEISLWSFAPGTVRIGFYHAVKFNEWDLDLDMLHSKHDDIRRTFCYDADSSLKRCEKRSQESSRHLQVLYLDAGTVLRLLAGRSTKWRARGEGVDKRTHGDVEHELRNT